MLTFRIAVALSLVGLGFTGVTGQLPPRRDHQPARDTVISRDVAPLRVKIGIWDSGVDTTLFSGRIARAPDGAPHMRGYDSFKRRQDTFLAVLDSSLLLKRDTLNGILQALDDLESGMDSPRSAALSERLGGMSKAEESAFNAEIGLWSGYVHGTAVADIALAGHDRAELVVARMEWWHGDPPVPCWSRELADREAASIADLLRYLVESGARVVNMSWNRAKRSYRGNLDACAPDTPPEERERLAQYTVDTIRAVLRKGMAESPQVLFVGAAGNAGAALSASDQATRFSAPNFILVGAVDQEGARTGFTNVGAEVTLFANGHRVPARLPGGALSFPSGTSMAAPNVTNAAARVLAVNPQLTGAELREILEASADLNASGDRLLNAARAVSAAGARGR